MFSNLDQHTIRNELNQKRNQWKFNPPSNPWMGIFVNVTVKFTKQSNEIMYLHWAGSVLTIIRIIWQTFFLPKFTRKEIHFNASSCETMSKN